MKPEEALKRAAALLRHMSDAGSTDEYRSCNDCATAIDALREELARQVPFAWATFDGEQGYDLRLYEEDEDYREDYIKRNGEKYASWVTPLYTAPQPAQVPVQHPDDEAADRLSVTNDG